MGVLVVGLVAADAGVLAALSLRPHNASTTTTVGVPGPRPNPNHQPVIQLVSYGGCPQMLSGIKAEAATEVGPYGWANQGGFTDGGFSVGGGVALGAPTYAGAGEATSGNSAVGAASPAAAPANGGSSASNFSATNDQEVGVDESDVVKTDGRLMVYLRQGTGTLEVADVSGATPHLTGSLHLPQGASGQNGLFLTGGYAVVMGDGQSPPAAFSPATGAYQPQTVAYVVSLADPAHPTLVRTFNFQGSEAGARLIDGKVVVVVQNQPMLPFVQPTSPTAAGLAAATAANKAIIASSKISDWLPSVSVSPGGSTWTASCQTALHPTVASGVSTVSVVSFDPAADHPGQEVSVVGNAETVYASTTSLYVATTSWANQVQPVPMPAQGGVTAPGGAAKLGPAATQANTDIHGFDLSDPTAPTYIGSAQLQGSLIGQYAMSEYNGDLRVATTVGQATPPPGEGQAPTALSDNRVTVLAPDHGALVTVGSIGGLGRGEKIYGVRFEGPLGYVVTFRQTDPLYVLDLSHPAHPSLDGSLALTGYSAFLQPLGDGLLLGVGEGVDQRLRQTGVQLSVFDVSNPNAPSLRSRVEIGASQSAAQNDPHAVLWWPANRILAIPVMSYEGRAYLGVWRVGTDGTLHKLAQLSQPISPAQPDVSGGVGASGSPTSPPGVAGGMPSMPVCMGCNAFIDRAVVIGSLLYTTAPGGIMANDMTTWNRAAWLPFTS
ncbi:MAG TPA: beta-propeller domain-containing protein [Acidimicrobiales bacterium]|nr:beta-propeller domain-containing protein [Acidimicrobiales bacterium]